MGGGSMGGGSIGGGSMGGGSMREDLLGWYMGGTMGRVWANLFWYLDSNFDTSWSRREGDQSTSAQI